MLDLNTEIECTT